MAISVLENTIFAPPINRAALTPYLPYLSSSSFVLDEAKNAEGWHWGLRTKKKSIYPFRIKLFLKSKIRLQASREGQLKSGRVAHTQDYRACERDPTLQYGDISRRGKHQQKRSWVSIYPVPGIYPADNRGLGMTIAGAPCRRTKAIQMTIFVWLAADRE
ncbi:hypothetical protein CEXT_547961 [Caerostris extrusa]|uniref:Uncharacterized protein n=1 Tax=Caerostris extrusa TaxID=172846 RepID=A0AAV4NYQ7_CAEEX|nr:hypothetical protein CEXT_547961 [Caerostris extrusa]